ncbi:MAG: acylphosphatase [Myxococcales bacterium]|nr:acylphosphatase [Myxococcales bacterium]
MSAPQRLHLVVRGRVQGVYYRASTQDQARRLSLGGWVRNLPDGSVELVAEGPRGRLEILQDWCAEGPPAAEVTEIVPHWLVATGEFADFQVRR